ncbi:MAG: hypothetical protein JSV21_02385 [Nitrospirota bacterium]|nr:MAG: hypothetical protein JSV21_02385 [Nitrospirota bacterium]
MSKRTLILITLLIVVPVSIYFLMPGDKARIRKMIRKGAAAVEQENLDETMKAVSLSYRDEHGMTYLLLKKGFERFFRMFDDIEVDIEKVDVTVDDDAASSEIYVRVIATRGTERSYIVGDAADPLKIVFSLEKEKIRWQITSARGMPGYYY